MTTTIETQETRELVESVWRRLSEARREDMNTTMDFVSQYSQQLSRPRHIPVSIGTSIDPRPRVSYDQCEWVTFDEASTYSEEVAQRVLEASRSMEEDFAMRRLITQFRGTTINIDALPKSAVDIAMKPNGAHYIRQKEIAYLELIQHLSDQIQTMKAVNKCTVTEEFEL